MLIYHDKHSTVKFSEIDDITNVLNQNNTFIIADDLLTKLYPEIFLRLKPFIITSLENNKSLDNYSSCINQMLSTGIERNVNVIGIGGGIVCDFAGFIASTYKRGTQLTLIPTTLLAQVDASIGGKNGLNCNPYKNVIGCFKIPDKTIICTDFLKTLTNKQIFEGIAEVLKIAIIYDINLFNYLGELSFDEILKQNTIKKIINTSINSKIKIVNQDFYDSGFRNILNFGHTFAHSIEIEYNLSHGDAVAIGIMTSVNISKKLNIVDPQDYNKVTKLLETLKLSSDFNADLSIVAAVLKNDKKINNGKIREILIEGIGKHKFYNFEVDEYIRLINDLH
ncbi:3-dehydroquinate synthase [Candidatus Kapaibacterium sp.]